MLLKQFIDLFDILDSSTAGGAQVAEYLKGIKKDANIETYTITGPKGSTDMVKVRIPGKNGKSKGGTAPTIGLLGRLGGLGARPEITGFVSDGDGALIALVLAAKLLDMQNKGDVLEGDVFVSTHVCPNAPTKPHFPVPFMGSPVEMAQVNKEEVSDELDAILSVDTTKGNRIINHRGFAISPTVKEGYILKTSNDLLDIMQTTTGRLPKSICLNRSGYYALRQQPLPFEQHSSAMYRDGCTRGRRGHYSGNSGAGLRHRSQPFHGYGGSCPFYAGNGQGLRQRNL